MDNDKGLARMPKDTPSVKKGKNYILAIGIDDYAHHRSLHNAVADAKAFVEVMTQRYGFENLIDPLYNKDATQKAIKKALGKCESLSEHDRLIVFYSGHGWYKVAAKLGYLVPADAEDDPHSDFIEVTSILNIFKTVKAQHILLVVDCCFGGSFGVERTINVADMTAKVVSELDTKTSRMVLSSGGIEPVSDGFVTDNNSPFTKPLVEILAENKAEKIVFSEFFTLLRKKTNWNATQLPQYKVLQHLGHNDGELAICCTDLESPEERAYRELIETPSIALMEKFIREFKNSEHKAAVRSLLKEKRAEAKWERIKNSRHIEVFDEFIDDFPDSSFTVLAQKKIDDLEIINYEAEENARKEKERLEMERQKRTEAEKQKKITEENARKEKERLAAIERKKREEEERLRLLYEPEMVFVKGGTFKMGSNEYDDEKPIHSVTLSDFSIGKYPVTQKQWQAIMGSNPSYFKGDDLPVEKVSWDDCQTFIQKLNDKTGKKYRLPTEAEWEYAARGGNQSKGYTYSGSNNIDEVAWYWENSGDTKLSGTWDFDRMKKNNCQTHPVGTKKANELGIYDMSGNVWEWCSDWYNENYYKNSPAQNPQGATTGSNRVTRGGGWHDYARYCRVAYRYNYTPTNWVSYLGFRLALSSSQ